MDARILNPVKIGDMWIKAAQDLWRDTKTGGIFTLSRRIGKMFPSVTGRFVIETSFVYIF